MIKCKEILRLHKQGISGRSIATSVSCSRNTVSKVLEAARNIGLEWPVSDSMSDLDLARLLFPEDTVDKLRNMPDFDHVHKELAKNGVTLSLLWHEYSETCRLNQTIPYQYSQFCKLYTGYSHRTKATMRIHHKPGEKLEVDWAGQTAFIKDNITGHPIKAYVFVAVLPYSGYTYVEAFLKMNMESWIKAHVNCFEYMGGVARILVPDNLKTGVDRISWNGSEINRTYNEMGCYYNTAVIPARVRHPKDKASAEGAVGNVTTWILASLRNRTFFSLPELNRAIGEKLSEFNNKPYQIKDGCRESVFRQEEWPCLIPLPDIAYEMSSWTTATVQYNYHVTVDRMNYSVPYEYIRHKVDIRLTNKMVEVFYNSSRLCSHPRLYGDPGQYKTLTDHMPEKHQMYQEWNAERFISWASHIGINTELVVKSIIALSRVEQQAYRSCMALLKSADKYSIQRLENACQKALSYTPSPSYKSVQHILKSGADILPPESNPERSHESSEFAIRRGSEYYGRKEK